MDIGLHTLIYSQADKDPHALAVTDGALHLSYGALEERSEAMAGVFAARGLRPDDRLCLLLPKSATAICAMLAALSCGAIYSPLDTSSPAPRLSRAIGLCEPRALVADRRYRSLVRECAEVLGDAMPRVWWTGSTAEAIQGPDEGFELEFEDSLEVELSQASRQNADGGPKLAAPSELAYIIFTSGSTGAPKGVPIKHSSVIHFSEWLAKSLGLGPGERISGHPPFNFDLSVLDIYGALTAGAHLCLVPDSVNMLPGLLAGFIREADLTQWSSVPAALSAMVARDVIEPDDFPQLRRILWCGDALAPATAAYLRRRLPRTQLVNLYGPTETTVASSYHVLPAASSKDDEPIPIGRPLPGERFAVLDGELRPVGTDQIGDLYIAGAGQSPGYWRDPETTSNAFVRISPDDGEIWYRTGDLARVDATGVFHFHGRTDRQIKSRGYRIELDEIAAAMRALRDVAEVAVVAVPVTGMEGHRVCVAYVLTSGAGDSPAALRRALMESLPAYMVPVEWLCLDELPRTANGKVDHAAVESRFRSAQNTREHSWTS